MKESEDVAVTDELKSGGFSAVPPALAKTDQPGSKTEQPAATVPLPRVAVAPRKAQPKAPVVAASAMVTRRPPAAAPSVSLPVASAPTSSRAAKSNKKKGQGSVALSSGSGQGENTGRWTAEEHRLFLQGLEQHGKGWKKIASLIKSRTVVQIRTHAQKYFQKLAKARQNGEEGEITMEGRGALSSAASVTTSTAAQNTKRRRQTTGTKRKAIQSVVVSAQRQGKKMAAAQAAAGVPNPVPPLPAVAPALAHFVLPNALVPTVKSSSNSSKTNFGPVSSQGTISGPALEDSIFRFLTPAPVTMPEPQVNDVARQAGANPITLPSDNPSAAPTTGGEISPTGVTDLSLYPSWTDAKDVPTWYGKGQDVDALLDMGDSLDWLADTGDLHETYQPPSIEAAPSLPDMEETPAKVSSDLVHSQLTSTSVNELPHVSSNVQEVVPPLPSIFDGTPNSNEHLPEKKEVVTSISSVQLNVPTEGTDLQEPLFDTPMEEHDFVSTILEESESTADLPALG